VLFPIPGSPPSNTMLPGTSPPPSTLLNSSSCISIRGSSFADISLRYCGLFLWSNPLTRAFAADFAAREPESLEILISLNVFHSPQLGHLPIHLADSCPQLSHTYAILSLAILYCLLFIHKSTKIFLELQNYLLLLQDVQHVTINVYTNYEII